MPGSPKPLARVGDQVSHTQAFPMTILGALVGAAIVLGTATTGGLLLVAMVGAGACFGGFVGDMIGTLMPRSLEGPIVLGEPTILVGPGKQHAAICSSKVLCRQHGPGSQVAEGSQTVFLGRAGHHAARIGDHGTCNFEIAQGCNTVLVGGPPAVCAGLRVGTEVPSKVYMALGLMGLPMSLLSLGVTGTAAVFGLGMLGNSLGEKWFGHDTFGSKLTGFIAAGIGAKVAGGGRGLALDRAITDTNLQGSRGSLGGGGSRQRGVVGEGESRTPGGSGEKGTGTETRGGEGEQPGTNRNTRLEEMQRQRNERLRDTRLREGIEEADRRGELDKLPDKEREWLEEDPTGERKKLAYDPDKKQYKVNEAQTAEQAKQDGTIEDPQRAILDQERGADYVEGTSGRQWDVKDGSGGAKAIVEAANKQENILVDARNMTPAQQAALEAEVNALPRTPGSGEIRFVPKR